MTGIDQRDLVFSWAEVFPDVVRDEFVDADMSMCMHLFSGFCIVHVSCGRR